MYTYDVDLFRDRWLGPPGVTCIKFSEFDNMCVHVHVCGCVHMCVHDMLIEALEQFWNAQRETEWFKMHPILSNPVTCTCTCGPIFCCVFGHWWEKKNILFCITLRMLIFEPISQFFAMVMTRTHTDGDHSVSVQLQAPFQSVDLLGIPDSPSTLLTTLGLSTKLLTVSMLGSFMGYVSSKKAPLWMLMCMADLGPGENMGGFADPTLGCLLL